MIDTPLRSTLISGCFLAYGVGCILINLVTISWIRSADSVSIFATILVVFTCTPSFFTFVETPKFLQKKGKVTQMIKSLKYISDVNKTEIDEEALIIPLVGTEENYELIKDKEVVIDVEVIKKDPADRNKLLTILTTPL